MNPSGLVTDRKEGLWIYYRLHPQLHHWFIEMLNTTINGIQNDNPFARDSIALSEIPNCLGGICSA